MAVALGAQHATAPRSRVLDDAEFILAQAAKGVPESAIARMIGRSLLDVQRVTRLEPLQAEERPEQPRPVVLKEPRKRPSRAKVTTKPRKARSQRPRFLTPFARTAIQKVATYYGCTVEDLIGARGPKALQPIRQEAYYEVYQLRDQEGSRRYQSATIGMFFGGRDHSTILDGIHKHEKRLADRQMAEAA